MEKREFAPHRSPHMIYYALLQIVITICNPPSLTAGRHCVPLSASFIRPLPKPLCGFGGCCAACKAQRVVLCNRGQYIIEHRAERYIRSVYHSTPKSVCFLTGKQLRNKEHVKELCPPVFLAADNCKMFTFYNSHIDIVGYRRIKSSRAAANCTRAFALL